MRRDLPPERTMQLVPIERGGKIGVAVGTCGFKSSPDQGRVEIAYFTFPDFEGRGLATAMAGELLAIAIGSVEHPEDGTVLEWRKLA